MLIELLNQAPNHTKILVRQYEKIKILKIKWSKVYNETCLKKIKISDKMKIIEKIKWSPVSTELSLEKELPILTFSFR